MRKLFYSLAFALLAVCMASCEKESEVTISHFSISMERCSDQQTTLADLNSDQLKWNMGDKIAVFRSNGDESSFSVTPNENDSKLAEMDHISGKLSSAPYTAIFPASSVVSSNEIKLPAIQKSVDGRLSFFPMYGETENEQMQFNNLCGVLRIHLTQANTFVNYIVVIADNICGTFSINDNTAIYSSNGGNVVTMTCTTPQSINGDGHDFYICLPAGNYNSLELKIANSEGGIADYNCPAIKIDRSKFSSISIADLDFKVPEINIVNGALPGIFSVGETKQVQFSMGNLQYIHQKIYNDTSSDSTGRRQYESVGKFLFAEHQFDIIGMGNHEVVGMFDENDSLLIDSLRIDLFGWATSGYNDKFPYSTDTASSNYGDGDKTIMNTNYDWGKFNPIVNGGNRAGIWRTMSRKEWNYLLYERNNADNLYGTGSIEGVHGLFILPDVWILPVGLTFTPRVAQSPNTWSRNHYTVGEWKRMEAAGAVFLPAAGYRSRAKKICDVNSVGAYWSVSNNGKEEAYYTYFDPGNVGAYETELRSYGYAVRLVKNK